jgi:integrase/recombinase XerD
MSAPQYEPMAFIREPGTLLRVAMLDFSGKSGRMPPPVTLAACLDDFLADLHHLERLRPHTLRAYRYELAAAAADPRFQRPLEEWELEDIETWLARAPAAASTLARRVATFRRFFDWAGRHGLCRGNPLADRTPVRGRRGLPRPIREQHEQRALDAAIARTPQPYRLIFLLLRETGMRVGEVLELRWGDVILEAGREALRVREPKNGLERTVILGPTATPRALRGLRSTRRALGHAPAEYDILFCSNRGTRVSYDAVHYQWAKLGKVCGPRRYRRRASIYASPTATYARQRAHCAGPARRNCPAGARSSRHPFNPRLCRAPGSPGPRGIGTSDPALILRKRSAGIGRKHTELPGRASKDEL